MILLDQLLEFVEVQFHKILLIQYFKEVLQNSQELSCKAGEIDELRGNVLSAWWILFG
jgi:hypothetical protein